MIYWMSWSSCPCGMSFTIVILTFLEKTDPQWEFWSFSPDKHLKVIRVDLNNTNHSLAIYQHMVCTIRYVIKQVCHNLKKIFFNGCNGSCEHENSDATSDEIFVPKFDIPLSVDIHCLGLLLKLPSRVVHSNPVKPIARAVISGW